MPSGALGENHSAAELAFVASLPDAADLQRWGGGVPDTSGICGPYTLGAQRAQHECASDIHWVSKVQV